MALSDAVKCTAKAKTTGKQCKNPAMPNGKCRMHGGRTPSGLASPHYKHGLYSKSIPARLETNHAELLALGDYIFRINDETTLMTALIQEQVEKMEQGESGAAWRKLKTMYSTMLDISTKPTQTPAEIREYNNLFSSMGSILNQGVMMFAARDEVAMLVDSKRKLVNDERRVQAAKHQSMTYDRVMLVLTAMASAFKRALEKHVENQKSRQSVLLDTQQSLTEVLN